MSLGSWFPMPWRRRPREEAPARAVEATSTGETGALTAEAQFVIGKATDAGGTGEPCASTMRVVALRDAAGHATGWLTVLCDGVGGRRGATRASRLASEAVTESFVAHEDPARSLPRAVRHAHRALRDAARADAMLRGAGTTCTALAFRDGAAWCAHVGDTRCTLLRGGDLFVMTNPPVVGPGEHALGTGRQGAIATWPRPFVVRPGDRFLVATGRLHDAVGAEELLHVASDGAPEAACRALIAAARAGGVRDPLGILLIAAPPL